MRLWIGAHFEGACESVGAVDFRFNLTLLNVLIAV